MAFTKEFYNKTLFQALLDARKSYGGKFIIAEDVQRKPLTYNQLIARCFILGEQLAKISYEKENIGVLLPTTNTAVVTFFALTAYNRLPAMLNFSLGSKAIISACQISEIKTILTSRQFIATAKLEDVLDRVIETGLKVIYLEDIGKAIKLKHKLKGLASGKFATRTYKSHLEKTKPDDPAVVLFTSGSEGVPKGVVLSHSNILANVEQLRARVNFTTDDKIFNPLPIFHCFGLTAGTILPIVSGVKGFFYPSPLHYRIIPKLVHDHKTTIMFGTDTFLNGYSKYATAHEFQTVRYIFAGAEKVKPKTTKLWLDKFDVMVFEGYGATEASPVISVNSPGQNKIGSVGRLLPQILSKISPVEGIEKGGRLLIKGPNVKLGYFIADNPGQISPTIDGWHDTGDIVEIDTEGFIFIKGRAKRFAKIGGEMVSLSSVELIISELWPEHQHAIISIADDRKGEQLILFTEYLEANKKAISEFIKAQGISALNVPKQINIVDEIPLLTTGKVNYRDLEKMADNAYVSVS